jgi:hypothetical protein
MTHQKLPASAHELLAALADILGKPLSGPPLIGPQGTVPHLGTKRTEEILLLLLRHGVTVPAHKRAYTIEVPPELIDAVHAAGGETRQERTAQRDKGKG